MKSKGLGGRIDERGSELEADTEDGEDTIMEHLVLGQDAGWSRIHFRSYRHPCDAEFLADRVRDGILREVKQFDQGFRHALFVCEVVDLGSLRVEFFAPDRAGGNECVEDLDGFGSHRRELSEEIVDIILTQGLRNRFFYLHDSAQREEFLDFLRSILIATGGGDFFKRRRWERTCIAEGFAKG